MKNPRMNPRMICLLLLSITLPVRMYDPNRASVFCDANIQCAGELNCMDGYCACPSGLVAQVDLVANSPKCVPFNCSQDEECEKVFREYWGCFADHWIGSCEAPEESLHDQLNTTARTTQIRSCHFKAQFDKTKASISARQQQQTETERQHHRGEMKSEATYVMVVVSVALAILAALLVTILVLRIKECIYPSNKSIDESSPCKTKSSYIFDDNFAP